MYQEKSVVTILEMASPASRDNLSQSISLI